MPGTPITIDLPTNADTVKDAIAKINVVLTTLKDDAEPKITPAEITIDSGISMRGYALTHVGAMVLDDSPTNNGTGESNQLVFYNGEAWLVTASGAVQVTDSGAIIAGGSDGFYGEYVGTTARATYADAAGEFIFTDDTAQYSTLVAGDIALVALTSGHRGTFKVINDLAAATVYSVGNPPASGRSALTIDSAGLIVPADASSTPISNATKFSAALTAGSTLAVTGAATLSSSLSVAGTLGVTGTATLHTTNIIGTTTFTGSISAGGGSCTATYPWRSSVAQYYIQYLGNYLEFTGSTSGTTATVNVFDGSQILINPGGSAHYMAIGVSGLKAGQIISGVKVHINKTGAGSTFFQLRKVGGVITVPSTVTYSTPGDHAGLALAFDVNYTVVGDELLYVQYASAVGDSLYGLSLAVSDV